MYVSICIYIINIYTVIFYNNHLVFLKRLLFFFFLLFYTSSKDITSCHVVQQLHQCDSTCFDMG